MDIKLAPGAFPHKDNVEIVAFDPGKTVGVCHAILLRQRDNIWDVVFVTKERKYPDDAHTITNTDIDGADIIICEAWRLYADKAKSLIGDDLPGPRALGFIEGYLSHEGRRPPVLQSAECIRGLDPQYTKAVEEYIGYKIKSNHERDALKHILYYLVTGGYKNYVD